MKYLLLCTACSLLTIESVLASTEAVFFPVTKECKEETLANLKSDTDKHRASFYPFLIRLMEHDSVIGVIKIESESLSRNEMLEILLELKRSCYADSSLTSDVDPSTLLFLKDKLGVGDILGAEVENGELKIFFRKN